MFPPSRVGARRNRACENGVTENRENAIPRIGVDSLSSESYHASHGGEKGWSAVLCSPPLFLANPCLLLHFRTLSNIIRLTGALSLTVRLWPPLCHLAESLNASHQSTG